MNVFEVVGMSDAIACGQFHHHARPGLERPAPGRQSIDTAALRALFIQEDDIDRAPQEKGMDRAARQEQQGFVGRRQRTGMQAQQALNEGVGHPQPQPVRPHSVSARNLPAMGNAIMRNEHGKMHVMSGNISFTGASSASFSARWKRSLRR